MFHLRVLSRSFGLSTKKRSRPRRLAAVEQLEDRLVPAIIMPPTMMPPPMMPPTMPSAYMPSYPVSYSPPPASIEPTYIVYHPAATMGPLAGSSTPSGLSPDQIRQAYGINGIQFVSNGKTIAGDGSGETVAIVDAYDDPSIAGDLSVFDQQYNLAAPPSFTKVGIDANGNASTTSFPTPNAGWSGEIELDVEWVHAVAPNAGILLVEANSNNTSDLINAIDYARSAPGVAAVSMSWGGYEVNNETQYDSHFTTPAGHSGVTFFASSGDYGSPILWPAISTHVVGVGGTTLNVDAGGNYQSESAWSGSGGGLSIELAQPTYQNNLVISDGAQTISAHGMRAGPDVAYDADPQTGVAVYGTYGWGGWAQVGGTSAGAPQWAALMTIVDQGRALVGNSAMDGFTQTLPNLYQLNSADFNDITTGGNGTYNAGPGFDLVSGLGSPVAGRLVSDMIGVPQVFTSVAVSPATVNVGDGDQQQFTAVAENQLGQPMFPQPTFTWTLAGGSAGTISSTGVYTAPASGTGSDTIDATATIAGITITGTATANYLPGPTLTSLSANPNPARGTTASLSAVVTDPYTGSLSYSWSVLSSPSGATVPALSPASGSTTNNPGSNNNLSTTATFAEAGSYQFELTVTDSEGVSASGTVTVNVNQTLTSVVVSPTNAGIVDGAQQQFSATADDQFGNALATQPTFTWSVASGGSGTINSSGLYTAPSSGVGTDTVQASATVGSVSASGTATVSYAPGLTILSVTASPNPVTGTTTTLSVTAVDPFGTPYYNWMVASGFGSVRFSNNGSTSAATTKVTFMAAGSYTFQVMVADPSGHMISGTVSVNVLSTLSSLQLQPGTATVADGRQQQFMAMPFSQFNMMMTPPPSITWSVLSGLGTVSSTGVYTAPSSGGGTVIIQATATANGITLTKTATVTLIPAPTITSISASPNPVTGTTTTLSVTASNPGGGALNYGWMVVSSPGMMPSFSVNGGNSASTTVVTFYQAGTYTFQAMVMNQSGLMATAQVTVTVQQTLTSLYAPSGMMVYNGSQVQLMAMPQDQFHMPMMTQPSYTWALVSGPGSVSSTGRYTAPSSGMGTAVIKVTATLNHITVSGTLTVNVY